MGGLELILAVSPVLAFSIETSPGVLELGGLDQRQVRRPLGERFIEPKVIPPFHGDHISEPHMCHFVKDGVGARVIHALGYFRAENQ